MTNDHHSRMWLLLLPFIIRSTSSSDIECLRSIKESLRDPRRSLSSWEFNNSTLNFICSFDGVRCSSEGKLRSLSLGGMGLSGEFPHGLAHCSELTGLDLSNNHLFGPIPPNISRLIASTSVLDLSHCEFSDEIPADIANCKDLRFLKLNNNFLSGRIPESLASLRRLQSLTVVNNRLSGPIPRFSRAYFPRESYAHNAGLCGDPLGPCDESESWNNVFANGLWAGWSVAFALFMSVGSSVVRVYDQVQVQAQVREKTDVNSNTCFETES